MQPHHLLAQLQPSSPSGRRAPWRRRGPGAGPATARSPGCASACPPGWAPPSTAEGKSCRRHQTSITPCTAAWQNPPQTLQRIWAEDTSQLLSRISSSKCNYLKQIIIWVSLAAPCSSMLQPPTVWAPSPYPSYPHTVGLLSLQLQCQDTEQLGTGNRNEGGRGTDGEWNNTLQFYGSVTDEENLSTVPSLSNTELYKEHQKTPIPLSPAWAAPHLHPPQEGHALTCGHSRGASCPICSRFLAVLWRAPCGGCRDEEDSKHHLWGLRTHTTVQSPSSPAKASQHAHEGILSDKWV